MDVWADFLIVFGVIVSPVTLATEGWRCGDPDKPWFLPNPIRVPLAWGLWILVFVGFYFQDYPVPLDEEIQLLGRIITAFARTLMTVSA